MFKIFTWLADWVTYSLLHLSAESRLGDAVHFFIEDVTKIFALLILTVFAIGFFRSLLTPERVRKADEMGVEIKLEKITNMAAILGYGVMSTPGVVLDEVVVHAGGMPSPDMVAQWLVKGNR
ncbi:MAG: hypothetical protein COA84_01370 [Robiginitomaculum sp.]|nr:MAG: hypothetical protein COA84_01370 [Robiginitomaculum sp.]